MKQNNMIAVEDSLSNVRKALEAQGYQTVDMNHSSGAVCLVVSGMDQNLMGMQDLEQNVPIVIAKGKSAEEVVEDVRNLTQ